MKITRRGVVRDLPDARAKLMVEKHGWAEFTEPAPEKVEKKEVHVSTLLKSIRESEDRLFLEQTLRDERQRTKPRKSVIKAIEIKLAEQ